MKLSLNWLKNFVDLESLTAQEIASKLTMGAFEVEEVKPFGPALEEPILVGEILEIAKHPNADRLQVATVTTDRSNKLQIVCGAKNIKIGQKVPVSLPGAVVVNRKDGTKLAIKKTKIRGVESSGMLASPGELGIETGDPEGIFILPKNAPLGKSIIDYLDIKQDTVLEVGSRSNRGDALSVYGLAREISALTNKKTTKLDIKEPDFDSSVNPVTCEIEDKNDTFLFYTVTIENIQIKESPNWLKQLLSSVGTKPISNIVDITNYINFTFGQPMHAYDKSKLSGNLTARRAKKGEKITTLDNKVRELKEGTLVIADNQHPVAIAGIMGSKDTEVTDKTKDIVFEAAVFNPVKVRKGSREVGLTSESSKRFERQVDSNFTYKALLKAIELTLGLAKADTGNIKVSKVQQAGAPIVKDIKIMLYTNEVKRVLNIELKPDEISQMLEKLDFKCKPKSQNLVEIAVPEHRSSDITRQIDIIEEIARLYSYDKIPTEPPSSLISTKKEDNFTYTIKNHLLSAGFSEAYLSSLTGDHLLKIKDFSFDDSRAIRMMNPLSQEHSVLRQRLLPGLLEAAKLNKNYQVEEVSLFEIGKVYFADKKEEITNKNTGVSELLSCAIVATPLSKTWYATNSNGYDNHYFKMKGIIESLITRLAGKNNNIMLEATKENYLHPLYSLCINLNSKKIGTFGCLHPETLKAFSLTGPVVVCEILLDDLWTLYTSKEKQKSFKAIPTQPAVERDITIDIPKKHPASEVIKQVKYSSSKHVVSISLISVYELNNELRSLTFRLKLQDPEKTLTSKEVEDEVNKVIKHLTACFEAKFRV